MADSHPLADVTERLACHDSETASAGAADAAGAEEPAPAPPAPSNRCLSTETSDFNGAGNVCLSVLSEEQVSCGFMGTVRITFRVRCVENTTAVIITSDCHLASGFDGKGRVEYRIDAREQQARTFTESTNNRSLGLWDGGSSIGFVQQLSGAERLLVRFIPLKENRVTAALDIAGLREAIAPLRQAFHW